MSLKHLGINQIWCIYFPILQIIDSNLLRHILIRRLDDALWCDRVWVQFEWARQAITSYITISPKHYFNLNVTEHKLVLILIQKSRGSGIMTKKVGLMVWNSGILHWMLITQNNIKDTVISPVLIPHAIVFRGMAGWVLMIIGGYATQTMCLAI